MEEDTEEETIEDVEAEVVDVKQLVQNTIPRVEVPAHGFESYTLALTEKHVHLSWWNMPERKLTCEVQMIKIIEFNQIGERRLSVYHC